MKVILSETSLNSKRRPAVEACLGIFDGLHRGHASILRRITAGTKKGRIKSLLISFFPHPRYFYQKRFPGYLTTNQELASILASLGLDYFWVVKFNKRISRMGGDEFIDYVNKFFDIKKIVVGEGFRFGYKAGSSTRDLRRFCRVRGIGVEVVPRLREKGRIINSSLIRRLVKRGDFKSAKVYLGRPYSFNAHPVPGRGIGSRSLGVPTVNIDTGNKVLPRPGVYISLLKYKNRMYPAVSNLGSSPSIAKRRIVLETHILGFNKKVSPAPLEVVFVKYLRAERRFTSLKRLKKQINKDINTAKKFFTNHNILRLP